MFVVNLFSVTVVNCWSGIYTLQFSMISVIFLQSI